MDGWMNGWTHSAYYMKELNEFENTLKINSVNKIEVRVLFYAFILY